MATNGMVEITLEDFAQRDMIARNAVETARRSGNVDHVRLVELGRLASQHHMSPYSVLKYGTQGEFRSLRTRERSGKLNISLYSSGSPWPYVPLTLQQPQLAASTLQNQTENERKAGERQLNKGKVSNIGPAPAVLAMTASSGESSPGDSAEDDNGPRSRSDTFGSMTGVKRGMDDVSRSPRQEDSVMAEAQKRASPRPRAAGGLELSQISSSSSSGEDDAMSSTPSQKGSAVDALMPSLDEKAGSEVQIMQGPLSKDVMIAQDLEPTLAQARAEAAATTTAVTPSLNGASVVVPPTMTTAPAVVPAVIGGAAVKTSDTHPINISPIVPVQYVDTLSSGIYKTLSPQIRHALARAAPDSLAGPFQGGNEEHTQNQIKGVNLIRAGPTIDMVDIATKDVSDLFKGVLPMSQAQIHAQEAASEAIAQAEKANGTTNWSSSFSPVGNLYLSSCPGKKVRLTGPVRGRGAICRDLGLDLKRIQEIGVGAIICCLDDEELAFLGAPWHEYERSADELGIDVVRIPVAEGFAPTCHVTIDRAITSIVMDYSLRGISVLVHCRGGVGRAGLIACTWMLKMGIVRSSFELQAHQNHEGLNGVAEEQIRIDTVQRLINTIRRRRSPKAIETAEQVKFIMDVSSLRVMYARANDG